MARTRRQIVMAALLAGAVTALPACTPVGSRRQPRDRTKSWLNPPGEQVVRLETVIVHRQTGDEELNRTVWQMTDEGAFPSELRDRLSRNGLRASVAGVSPPLALSRMLAQKGKGHYRACHWTANFGRPRRVELTQERRPRTFLVSGADGNVYGQEFQHAVCELLVVAQRAPEGAITLVVTPVVQHGRIQSRLKPNARLGRVDSRVARQQYQFSLLALAPTVQPGQTLVLGSTTERLPSSVGEHFFFEAGSRGAEQKLLLVRVSQVGSSGGVEPPVRSLPTR